KTTETNSLGDFWFRWLKDNRTFKLRIEKGKKSTVIDSICTDDDRNLGDIPLK
ncbi:MAG: oxidoreductase, partial [Deltaproteobacteria bacterium]|nr:oxidoreductase [Deltaproteobacteria bacterium]